MRVLLLSLVGIALAGAACLADTLVVAQGKDGYQEGSSTTVSVFDRGTCLADRPTVRVRSTNARKVLLRWGGLARRLPAGRVVTSAKLRLCFAHGRNPEGAEVTAHEVLLAWDGATATWERRSAAAFWSAPGMHEGRDFDPAPAGKAVGPADGFTGWLEIPLSLEMVRRWVALPETNCVLKALQKAEPGLDSEFRGNACPDAAQRPQLVIEMAPGKPLRPLVPLGRLVEADTRLPAYVNADTATLGFQPTSSSRETLRLLVAFSDRITGKEPAAPIRVSVPAGPKRTDVRVGINAWPDGEYRVRIRETRNDGRDSGELVRCIRKQTIAPAPAPREPVPVEGLTTLFVDDWYLRERQGLRFRVHPAEAFPVTTGMLGENRPIQRGLGLSLEPDGTLVARLKDSDRREGNPRFYTARSRDGEQWDVQPDPNHASAGGPRLLLAADRAETAPSYRFYDPAADGAPALGAIRLEYTGYQPARWGDIAVPARSIYPVWTRSPGERIVLLREPLLQDRWSYAEGDLGDWKGTNDNFAGQWLSRDGKTLHYCQGRTIPRFPPFRVPYDNLASCNRILVVWSTGDGVRWKPTYFAMPTEQDPVGYQHYGAWIRPIERGALLFAYLYAYDQAKQQIRIEVCVSRDGLSWQPFPGQPAFAGNGPWGSWNCGHLFPTGPAVEKAGTAYQLLGYCSNRPHFYWEFIVGRDDLAALTPEFLQSDLEGRRLTQWPYWPKLGSWDALAEDMRRGSQTVGVLRFRKDGWVSLAPEAKRGSLVTRVLAAGKMLAINARTGEAGCVRVEVLDARGKPMPAYCGRNAARFVGDEVVSTLAWSGGALRELPAQPVRLRVTLVNADLFALSW